MGLLDDMQGIMSSATSSAGRSVELVKLKARMKEINQERTRLAAQLGAALYEKTKNDAAFVLGFENLYGEIGKLDSERLRVDAQISQIEREGRERAVARQTYECPNCKSTFSSGDLFCSGCGKRVDELMASMHAGGANAPAGSAKTCETCGCVVDAADAFCMRCGADLRVRTDDDAQVTAVQEEMHEETTEANPPAESQGVADELNLACPQCGSVAQADDCFCMNCGCNLR